MLASPLHPLRAAALALALALLAGLAGAGAAAAKAPTFKASVYGIQRYVNETSHQPVGEPHCLSTRGSRSELSTLRFTSTKPVRVRVTARRGVIALSRVGGVSRHLFDVRATFEATGDEQFQRYDCQANGWVDDESEVTQAADCGPVDVDDLGLDLGSPGRGRLGVSGGWELTPLSPIHECLWGDRSFDLYEASSRVDVGALLEGDAREVEVVLRGRAADGADDPASAYRTVRRSTVYVTLKRIG